MLREFREAIDDLPEMRKKQVLECFQKWTAQGMPLPCVSPPIKFEMRDAERQEGIYGCRLGSFYRAYCVLRKSGVAIWFFIGNHPDRGDVPTPPKSKEP